MYTTFEELKEIHVETTNLCNAACPMCARNDFGGRTRDFKLSSWNVDFIPKVFDKRFVNLRHVMFCGTHGDPAVVPQTLNAIEYLRSNFNITIELFTNGGTRNAEWWSTLGSLLQKTMKDGYHRQRDLVGFSIDGLEDTNHLYRRNVDWNTLMVNAEAYLKAGGLARWDFIVFKHNQHQVEEAEALAKKMGFKQFRIRKTARFNHSPAGPDKWNVVNSTKEDPTRRHAYFLYPTDDDRYYNTEIDRFAETVSKYGSKESYFQNAKIDCIYKNKFNRICVNAYGNVHPCSFVSNDEYPNKNAISDDIVKKVFNFYDKGFNSLHEHEWEDILNHPWYKTELEASWNSNTGDKLWRCSRTCGTEYSPILTQNNTSTFQ